MKFIYLFSKLSLFVYILCCISTLPAASNILRQNEGESGLFSSDEVLEVVVTADLKSLMKIKQDDEYQDGEITLNGKKYSVRLKARKTTLKENCSFPPIMLNFSKTNFDDPSFVQLEKLKQVSTCNLLEKYEQYILREYLIYRAFNIMSDKSYKVRLLKIEYADSKEKISSVTRFGFVIEDEYAMARRLDGMLLKSLGIQDQAANKKQMIMLSIFQFMMGNTNWQVDRLTNVTLLKLNEPAPYVIPYDFDYTGMVNASYATPSPILGIDSLRERLFWGKCYSESDLTNAVEYFLQKKEAIYDLYKSFEPFDEASLSQSLDFLDSFYTIISDEKSWKPYFVSNCKE